MIERKSWKAGVYAKSIIGLGLLVVLLFSACRTSSLLSGNDLLTANGSLSADYALTHNQKGSQLWIRCASDRYSVSIRWFEDYKQATPLSRQDKLFTDVDSGAISCFPVVLDASAKVLMLEIIDLNTGTRFVDVVRIKAYWPSEQTLYAAYADGTPILGHGVAKGSEIFVQGLSPVAPLTIKFYERTFSPAPPPYSQSNNAFQLSELLVTKTFNYRPGLAFAVEQSGLYFIQPDKEQPFGVFLFAFEAPFPKVAALEDLVLSLRYITKNEEYEAFRMAKDKKDYLDEFWLERAGDKELARKLISLYYRRVQEANLRFTTYKEGWKTDKGIIYIVFGKPQEIRKLNDKEFWYYKATPRREAVEFVFDVVAGQSILRRSPMFELPWSAQIYEWREGIVE